MHHHYKQLLALALLVCLGDAPATAQPTIDFNNDIRPIFAKHCTSCHGGVKQAGDISFVYRDQVLPPNGWIVEPGNSEESLLIERVLESDPELRMPPAEHGPALPQHEIDLLTQWIDQGAKWQTSHWAYEAPTSPALPEVSDPNWIRDPIDRFVMARLDADGLQPSPDADPERWLRRVSLDLIGLPPTLEQLDVFCISYAESPETAKQEAVDRLLQSPAFGERWASVWLDQVRYADSKGLGADGRRSVWKYRDWVIDSLNSDLPFDQFTIKQIAGDLLPNSTMEDRIATAAHRLTQSNEEGGTDDEEFRVAAVLDRVNTTWQTWQGVTFGCVQCHSHPYDPFRHEEYYQFAAFFNNTTDCDLNEDWPVAAAPLDKEQYTQASDLDRQIDRLKERIWEQEFQLLSNKSLWRPIVEMTATSNNQTQLEVNRFDDRAEFQTVGTVSRNTDITLTASLPDDMTQLTAIRLTAMPLQPSKAIDDSEWGFVISSIDARLVDREGKLSEELKIESLLIDEPDPFYDPQLSLDPKSNRGFAAYSRINHPRQAALILSSPAKVPPGAHLQVTLKHRVYLLAAFSLITRRGDLAVSDADQFTNSLHEESLAARRDELATLQKKRAAIRSVSVPVMQELPQHLSRSTHVFERGLFLTKGEQVTAGTPQSLPPLPEGPANRLTLAKWLASDTNPLTARVAVNRFWSQLFGIGIVATEEDFGSSGELPSHPELLDYLAVRFQTEHRWSVKALLREIVLSRTYGQAANVSEELLRRDPENRLLARGPRYRLPSETVRDQALALAGLMSDKQFGPPVHPPIPAGVWQPFQSGDRWEVAKQDSPDRHRRSIYTYIKRSIPYPMFAAFDTPSREFCAPRRLRSNTPLQALMMLNDQTFAECIDALAQRMRDADDQLANQIRYGYRLVTCRPATEEDVQVLVSLANETRSDSEADGLQSVAAVLLNLDEVVMK